MTQKIEVVQIDTPSSEIGYHDPADNVKAREKI